MYWLEFFWQDFRKDQDMYVGVFELVNLMENDPAFRKKAQALRATFTRKVNFFISFLWKFGQIIKR